MESLERKDISAGPEEPIKSEEVVPSPNTSERSNNAASPPPNCSICLGKLVNTSFTDSCLHQFCFTCLLQWSKIKTECPLCKQTFKSIIHNVRSEEDYDQYHVQYTSQVAATLDVTADIHISGPWDVGLDVMPRPFMYRTTMGAQRTYGMFLNPEAVARREQIPSVAPQVSVEERRRRRTNPIDFRRTVYRHGVWAASLPDAFGRFRESSAEFYRRHPSEVNRLIPWLNRELQVLLNNNRPHIAYVMGIITDTITQYDIRSDAFRNIVRPYFGIHTDHFVHELSYYARSNFDLIGYDQAVSYIPSNRGLSNEYVTRAISPALSISSSSSSDSDVCVLADSNCGTNRLNFMPSVGPHLIDAPGPSTVGQAFRIQMPSMTQEIHSISSSSSSSENECEVIGYVKPRHERTPEIIDLSSSEGEINSASRSTLNDNTQAEALTPLKVENMPSTSSPGEVNCANRRTRQRSDEVITAQAYKYLSSSTESDSSENDSDYNPQNIRSRRHKTAASKKTSRVASRKPRSRKRKKSTGTQRKRKVTRNRSYYSSCDETDHDSSRVELASSSTRGTKRYLSKSSDNTDTEKASKKKNKSKKSKTLKNTKKSKATSSLSSKTAPAPSYEYSSSCSGNSYNGSESENAKSKRLSSDLSDYRRSESPRRSSSGSYDSRKNTNRLQDFEVDNSQHCSSDEERGSSLASAYSDNESPSLYAKRKSSSSKSTTTTTTEQTTSQSSERCRTTTSSSNSSSKSDVSSPTEHSSTSKSSRDRHRSHKKRKESKKRKRSHS